LNYKLIMIIVGINILLTWFIGSTVYAVASEDDFYIGILPIVDSDYTREIMYIGSFGCVEGELVGLQYFMGDDQTSEKETVFLSKVVKEPRPDVNSISRLHDFCAKQIDTNVVEN